MAQTGAQVLIPEDYYSQIQRAQNRVTSDDGQFGDRTDVSTGYTRFEHTVVSLPGNNSLPVEVTYIYTPYEDYGYFYRVELARPYVSGVFSIRTGWVATSLNGGGTTNRCSITPVLGAPPEVPNTSGKPDRFFPDEYWHGNQLVMPDGSTELMRQILASAPKPTDGKAYPWTTKNHWYFSCLSPAQTGINGEGFLGVSPDGTKYYFDSPASSSATTLVKPSTSGADTVLQRAEIRLYVSRIEDRFGNWVKYESANGALVISSNDGRRLTIGGYATDDVTVSDGSRTWKVKSSIDGSGVARGLSVTNPDGTVWSLATTGDIKRNGARQGCGVAPTLYNGQFDTTVSTPSGAMGVFTLKPVTFGRSFVTYQCNVPPGKSYSTPTTPAFYDSVALTRKNVTGAGLGSLAWTYDYGPSNGCYSGSAAAGNATCTSASPSTRSVLVTNPDGSVDRYTVGNKYNDLNEGALLAHETGASPSAIRRTETTTWSSFTALGAVGSAAGGIYADNVLRVPSKRVIAQDGDAYTWQATDFDAYANPIKITRSNSISGQIPFSEALTYRNDTNLWVIGQLELRANATTGEVISKNVYDGRDQIVERWQFGRKLASYAYESSGNLSSVTDGNANRTSYSNYKLGIPTRIAFPDGYATTSEVDSLGQIRTVTDQAGNKTSYDYDTVGRISKVTYPDGDERSWYPQSFSYEFVTGSERGISGTHWRRTVAQGDSRVTTYFDALLRPILTDTFMASVTSSHVSARMDYDWQGRKIFESYPSGGQPALSALSGGNFTTYDVLGRVTKVQRSAEAGLLTTATTYLSGAGRQVVDPKGYSTTTRYQVFDQPSYESIISVQAPEGVNQSIARNVYGDPTSIRQWGTANGYAADVTKYFYYDAFHRICRTTEPESGSQILAYDGADNVSWTASGLTITGSGCGAEQVAGAAKTVRSYDAMNRVKAVQPPSGTQSTTYIYDATGNIKQADSGITHWTAERNKRGQLLTETLSVNGNGTSTVRYAHDGYGSLSVITYPDGTAVDYAPDALGRPTKAGAFAGSVSYLPDGDVAHFIYGNGTEYLAQKNTRQLLSNFTYAKGGTFYLSEDIAYDGNDNISTITDLAGGPRKKVFGYDQLNRLTSAQAPSLWGAETFRYDALNNMRSRATGGLLFDYNYDAINRLVSITQAGKGVTSLGYDNRGNVVSKNGNALLFDYRNQLTSISGYGSYAYDGAGRRVLKSPSNGKGATYYFYNSAGRLLYQYEPTAAKATDFVYLGSKLIARYERSLSVIRGNIDSVAVDSNGLNAKINGWACSSTIAQPIKVHLYVGGPYGAGTYIGQYDANLASEAAVATACGVGSGSFRFSIALTDATRVQYSGKAIYVHGISPVGNDNALIGASGNFAVPPMPNAPAAPGAISASAAADLSRIDVSWSAVSGVSSYKLERQVDSGAWAQVYSGTALSFTMSSPPDGKYGFRVQACNTAGCSAPKASAIIAIVHVPPVPASISAPATSTGSLTVSWPASSWATGYVLEQSMGGSVWVAIYSASGTSTTFSVGSTGSYAYRVKACNANGCSGYVTSGAVVVTVAPTAAPVLGAPASSNTGAYTVSWNAIAGASSYTLQERVNGGSWANVQSNGATSWAAGGKGTGTYGYQVRACNAGGCGPWSAAAQTTVSLLPPVPSLLGPPSTVKFAKGARLQITISWTSSAGASRYEVEMLDQSMTTSGTSQVVRLTTAGTYDYRVRACNSNGCSAWVEGTVRVQVQGELES